MFGKLQPYSSYLAGIASYNKSRSKMKGLKPSLANNFLSYASIIPQIALLAEEGQASIRGYNALKRMGLSKEELDKAKKELLASYSSYLLSTISPQLTARISGNVLGKIL